MVLFTSSGELGLHPAMAPPSGLLWPPASSLSLSPIQSGSFVLNPTARIRRYRFGCDFVKETLSFYYIEPAFQNVKSGIRFDLLKAYFVSVNEKYVF
jgi:hypothetical protein